MPVSAGFKNGVARLLLHRGVLPSRSRLRQPRRQYLHQRRMPIQRRRDHDIHARVRLPNLLHDPRQVPIHVQAEREEVRQDHDALRTSSRELIGSALQARLPQFEKRRYYLRVPRRAREIHSHRSHSVISGFDARTVGKNDYAGTQGFSSRVTANVL